VPAHTRAIGDKRSPAALRGEIAALTGLRAVAATWVVLYHVTWLSEAYLGQLTFLAPIAAAGWVGVELFFVLSGFVIAHRYLDQVGSRLQARIALRFLYNRIARVWPAYAIMTLVPFLWLFAIGRGGWNVDVVAPHPEPTPGELVRQLLMTQMWGEARIVGRSFNPPEWSVSAEWLAYLAFPLLALLLRPLRRLHPVILLGLSGAAMLPLFISAYEYGAPDVVTNWFMRISCCFVAGILACLAARGLYGRPWAEQLGLALSVTSLIAVVLLCYWASWRATQGSGDFAGVVTVVFPLLIAGLTLTRRGPARMMSATPLLYGGRISYCLYLVHFFVMDVVVTSYWQDSAKRGEVPPALALGIPLIVFISFVLGAALHHGVEEPARRLMLSLPRRAKARVAWSVARGPADRSGTSAITPAAELCNGEGAPGPGTRQVSVGARVCEPGIPSTVGPHS
jgi:peptidoglycan/LPS O-acetylase OafA/YrhL